MPWYILERIVTIIITYIRLGADYLSKYIMTVEGVIAMLFGLFVIGLFSRIFSS